MKKNNLLYLNHDGDLIGGSCKSSVTNRLPSFYPWYILKCFTALEWCVEKLTIPVYFVQIAFQLIELIQIEIDAVIYTDQFTLNIDQKTEIRSYIKYRIRLHIDSKQIFNDLCGIYGPQTILIRHVFSRVIAFKAGKFSIEDDTRPGRPKISVTKANIATVKIVVERDARLSDKDIASCTGISEGSMQTILKKRLDLRKVCTRWVPQLFTEEQKTQRLKCALELLKTYKGCNSRVISNLLADLFLYSYEAEFVQSLLQAGKKHLAQQFNFTYRYIDDVLSLKTQNLQSI